MLSLIVWLPIITLNESRLRKFVSNSRLEKMLIGALGHSIIFLSDSLAFWNASAAERRS